MILVEDGQELNYFCHFKKRNNEIRERNACLHRLFTPPLAMHSSQWLQKPRKSLEFTLLHKTFRLEKAEEKRSKAILQNS